VTKSDLAVGFVIHDPNAVHPLSSLRRAACGARNCDREAVPGRRSAMSWAIFLSSLREDRGDRTDSVLEEDQPSQLPPFMRFPCAGVARAKCRPRLAARPFREGWPFCVWVIFDGSHGFVAGGTNSLRLNGRIVSPGGWMLRTRASEVGGP